MRKQEHDKLLTKAYRQAGPLTRKDLTAISNKFLLVISMLIHTR